MNRRELFTGAAAVALAGIAPKLASAKPEIVAGVDFSGTNFWQQLDDMVDAFSYAVNPENPFIDGPTFWPMEFRYASGIHVKPACTVFTDEHMQEWPDSDTGGEG